MTRNEVVDTSRWPSTLFSRAFQGLSSFLIHSNMGKYKHPVPGFCYFMLHITIPASRPGERPKAQYFLIYSDMSTSSNFFFINNDSNAIDYLANNDAQIDKWENVKPFYPPPTTDLKDFINAVTEEKNNQLL